MQRASDRTQAAIILLAVNIIVALGLACYALNQIDQVTRAAAADRDAIERLSGAIDAIEQQLKDQAVRLEFLASCQQETEAQLRAPSVYGKCPKCGGAIVSRERRINGNDTCEHGHVFPSAEAVGGF